MSETPIPMMKLLHTVAGDRYSLEGFSNVDLWARANDTTWAKLTRECNRAGLQDKDRVRMLAAALLKEKHGQLDVQRPICAKAGGEG